MKIPEIDNLSMKNRKKSNFLKSTSGYGTTDKRVFICDECDRVWDKFGKEVYFYEKMTRLGKSYKTCPVCEGEKDLMIHRW